MSPESLILREVAEIPEALANAAHRQVAASRKVASAFAERPLRLIATIGRGSSDHVAAFLRSAFEITMGIPSTSIPPSIASIYHRQLKLEDTLCFVVSQSGRSPDIRQAAAMARQGGARVVAIVNDETSPLVDDVDVVVPIGAGRELAVAATKSFLGAASAGLRLLAALSGDRDLDRGLDALPDQLARMLALARIDLEPALSARTAFVVGRGPALGIAQEAALKMKEIVQFPAEAYSSAEVLHGPWQLAATDCALIAWQADEASLPSQRAAVQGFRELGRKVVDLHELTADLQRVQHHLLNPLAPLPLFYHGLAGAAKARGLDPDNPKLLRKVTETL